MTDNELKALVASLAVDQKAIQAGIADLRLSTGELQASIARQVKENDRRAEESQQAKQRLDAEVAASKQRLDAEVAASNQRLDERLAKIAEEMKASKRETDHQLRELGKQMGGLSNKWGSYTESLAQPAVYRILRDHFGCTDLTFRTLKRRPDGSEQEFDVLGWVNGKINTAVVVEIKSHLRDEGIAQILEQLADFPLLFPEHQKKKLFGMVVAVDIPKQIRTKAEKHGLLVAQASDETFELITHGGFPPTDYGKPKVSMMKSRGR